jgi:hypothetical protein
MVVLLPDGVVLPPLSAQDQGIVFNLHLDILLVHIREFRLHDPILLSRFRQFIEDNPGDPIIIPGKVMPTLKDDGFCEGAVQPAAKGIVFLGTPKTEQLHPLQLFDLG